MKYFKLIVLSLLTQVTFSSAALAEDVTNSKFKSVPILDAYRLNSGDIFISALGSSALLATGLRVMSYDCIHTDNGITLKIDLKIKSNQERVPVNDILSLETTETCDPAMANRIETQREDGKVVSVTIRDGSHLRLVNFLGLKGALEPQHNDEILQKDGSILFKSVGFRFVDNGGCSIGVGMDYGYRGSRHGAKVACRDRGYKKAIQFTAGCVSEKQSNEKSYMVPFNRLRLTTDIIHSIISGDDNLHPNCKTVLIDVTCSNE